MNNYIKLGFFTVLGIIAIIVSIIAVGDYSLSRDRKFYVLLDDATGLMKKAKVSISGVNIGFLQDIGLENGKAKLKLAITDENIKIYKNAKISLLSTGIVGVKFLNIFPGDPSSALAVDGDYLNASESLSLNDMLEKLTQALNSDTAGNILDNFVQTISNLKEITANLKRQNQEIENIVKNVSVFSSNLAQITSENKQDLREAVVKFKDISEKMDIIIAQISQGNSAAGVLLSDPEMGEALKETIESAKETVQSLQSAMAGVGGLQMQWNYEGVYDAKAEHFKNNLGVKIIPNDNKFYYIGISNVGAYKSDNIAYDENDIEIPINTLDALMGFRKDNFEVYAGAFQSQGGFGAGYSFLEPIYSKRKTLQLHLNAYNFGRKKNGPVVDVDFRIGVLKWLYVGAMIEDAMYRNAFTPYIKLEIDDEDLARLLGVAGLAASASR